jgi:Na+-translocating ferredoxin:NAD+ oxidoreductase RnfD subunit
VTIVLAILVAVAAPGEGWQVVPGLVSAVVVAGGIDVLIIRWRQDVWEFPSGAVLTGLFVAMILRPQEPWYVPAVTSALAVVS